MSNPKFLQIHTLTSYPATLLNRDDAGFAKRLPFGGASRTRVSSQCLKYHWRNFEGEHSLYSLDVAKTYRSRETFQRKLAWPLINAGHPEPLVRAGVGSVKEFLLGGKKAKKADIEKLIDPSKGDDKYDPWEELQSSQITIFGEPEMKYLRELIQSRIEEIKDDFPVYWEEGSQPDKDTVSAAADVMRDFSKGDLKKNLKGLEQASGLDAAMFGRMVTSDILARGDAAIHVAHSFTTHEEESESDYFSAVDELRRDEPEESGELGAGHINSTELSSGLFYNYVVVDIPLLVSNLQGVSRSEWNQTDKTLAAEVVKRMVHLIATVSPGAKLGSTAPYSYAQCLLVEAGNSQPRTLANAFQEAVPTNRDGILTNTYRALGDFVADMDQMYGKTTERRLAATGPKDILTEKLGMDSTSSVPDIANWVANQIKGA
ncbi:MAG: type I-E CRISPR-associated protein Cas7/Cse4/CasC [Bacteroidetes bacterium]|jgi:CRISPR system Cascade subunit CasC|nr:type I-E CRISPR-associated protein Cas7/Cse4/CasC [Bacteroidota bacterium]